MTVYQVIGGGSRVHGRFWSVTNPNLAEGYASRTGLPLENRMTTVIRGYLTDTRGITAEPAAPGVRSPGGMMEIRNVALGQVQVTGMRWFLNP